MNKSDLSYLKVDIYSFQFYLQIGYICSPEIVELSYNKERIREFDFPLTLEFMNGLPDDFLVNLEDDYILLEFNGLNFISKKFVSIHIKYINRIVCSDVQIESLQYLFNGNGIPYQFEMVRWDDFTSPIKKKQLKITRVNRETNKAKIHEAWRRLKLKGGLSLLRALPLVIEKRTFMKEVLSLPYVFTDDFGRYSLDRFNDEVYTEENFVGLISKYSKYLQKHYGFMANTLVDFIKNPMCNDDLQKLFELTNNLKNSKSNFSVLEFAFLHRKYKKLNNSISRDMEKAMGEVMLAWDNMHLSDCDLVRLVFQLGHVAGYASLYQMEGISQRGGRLLFSPNLDELGGLGLAVDVFLEVGQPGTVLMPVTDNIMNAADVDDIVDSVFYYQYENLLIKILENDELHRKIAGLKLIFSKFDTAGIEEFHSYLLKLADRCIDQEPPHFANILLDNIKNKKKLSSSDISFLNLISNGIDGVVRMLP
jgi:hypothetical protein